MTIHYSTSFAGIQCNQLDNGNTQDPDPSDSRLNRHGDWTTASGAGWQVTSAANYSGGGGGNGFRNWIAPGTNGNSGGCSFTPDNPMTEFWFRYYARWQTGFSWAGGNPEYTKNLYMWSTGGGTLIFGHQGGAWGFHNLVQSLNIPGTVDWTDIMGGATSDGQFHLFEGYALINGASSRLRCWIDDVETLDTTTNLGTNGINLIGIGENQDEVTNGGDEFNDFDDFAISLDARIGPIDNPTTAPPSRIMFLGTTA